VTTTQTVPVDRITPSSSELGLRRLPIEAPVAIEYNGIGYAVMMATPTDLEDFAAGFSLSEQIISDASEISHVQTHEIPAGWILRIEIPLDRMTPVTERARQRLSESGCGLCGIESLERIAEPLPILSLSPEPDPSSIFAALDELSQHQPLNRATGGVHAAAFCTIDGTINIVREDVGRHNALDKTIGALAAAGKKLDDGFLLLTSRCSYELVEKAVRAGCPTLGTVSTATSLATKRALMANLRLIVLARPDAMLRIARDPDTKPAIGNMNA
jgi:FdhD protein